MAARGHRVVHGYAVSGAFCFERVGLGLKKRNLNRY